MDKGNNARYVAELQTQAIRFADKLHEQFFPLVESRLLEMADMARNNENQWQLLQLARELKRQKPAIVQAFKKHLAGGFEKFSRDELGGKDTRKEDMSADLSLVADDELEQNLAVTSLSRRAETRFAETLFALNQRMAMLKGGRKLTEDGNPLGPYQFADALQMAFAPLKLDTRLTVLFFRIFEKALLENLGGLYETANDYLIKQGVLPNLRYGMGSRTTAARPAPQDANKQAPAAVAPPESAPPENKPAVVASQPPPAAPVAPGGSEDIQRRLYDAICQLQQQRGLLPAAPVVSPATGSYAPGFFSKPAVSGGGSAAAVAVCSQNEVIEALAGVAVGEHADVLEQAAVPPAMTVENFQSITHKLRQNIGEDKQVGDDDGRIIDLVGMIFEYMLGDKQLPDSVKAVLSYMHTPYLKAAFIDRHLFEQPEHPSRQLLNCLAEAGVRWVNSDGDSQFKVFPKIKSVVRRVLTEFNRDMSLFDELLAEMQEFNQKVENSIALIERRSREKAEGEDRLREVKRRVLVEVRKRMQGYDLPSALVVLLLHPWSDYLTFTLLRHGEDSSQWQEGLDTIEDIIWSVQPKNDAADRNRMLLIQEPLHARVQAALETIAYDQAKSNKLLDALNKAQLLALQNLFAEPLAAEKRAEMEADAGSGLDPEIPDPDKVTESEREMVEKLRMVEFGTWMEFDELDQHRNLRAKIAWFNSTTSRYMLVDRSGKQIAMKSGLELARLILASQARMIAGSTKPFFERALENILARLKTATAH